MTFKSTVFHFVRCQGPAQAHLLLLLHRVGKAICSFFAQKLHDFMDGEVMKSWRKTVLDHENWFSSWHLRCGSGVVMSWGETSQHNEFEFAHRFLLFEYLLREDGSDQLQLFHYIQYSLLFSRLTLDLSCSEESPYYIVWNIRKYTSTSPLCQHCSCHTNSALKSRKPVDNCWNELLIFWLLWRNGYCSWNLWIL